MKIASIAFSVVLTAALIGIAKADDVYCPANTSKTSMSIEQALSKAESLGYSVKEAKRSKGCWKIEGFDRNGAEIEIRFDPTSGDVMKPRDWRQPAGG